MTLEEDSSQETRSRTIRMLFGSRADVELLEAYMNYYTRQCSGNRSYIGHYGIAKDLVIGQRLRDFEPISTSDPRWATIYDAIFLACRLLTMVNVPILQLSGRSNLKRDDSLERFLRRAFPPSARLVFETEPIKHELIARNISEKGRIKIAWTDNLADHLRLEIGGKTLYIFHHASFLKSQKTMMYWPAGFIDETLHTLSLLFPPSDRHTKIWYEEQRKLFKDTVLDRGLLDCEALKPEDMNLKYFNYWRDQLEVLQDAYEMSNPARVVWKALGDRGNGNNWLNSWAAIVAIIFTLFFGLVQSIEGAIQVYKAYHPTRQ